MESNRSNIKRMNTNAVSAIALAVALSGCVAKTQPMVERPEALKVGLEQLESGDRLNKEDAFEITSMADGAYDVENWAVAEKFYRKLTQRVPQDAYGYFRLGNSLMQQLKLESAIKAYGQSLKRDPTQVRAMKNRSLAFLLQAELLLGDTVKMLESVDDTAAAKYKEALFSLQRLNDIPLNETVSPLEGLYSEL